MWSSEDVILVGGKTQSSEDTIFGSDHLDLFTQLNINKGNPIEVLYFFNHLWKIKQIIIDK